MNELLTPEEMAEADRLAALSLGESYRLMLNAGQTLAHHILSRYADAAGFDILCGPGNNGGDGYVLASLLHEHGCRVRVWRQVRPAPGTDAVRAAAECPVEKHDLAAFEPAPGFIVVDALFGAGLGRALEGAYAEAVRRCALAKARVVAVDLPSGVSGRTGEVLGGIAAPAELTVTFFRKKPGHLLFPGRHYCGEVVVTDIGIRDEVLGSIGVRCRENHPAQWSHLLPRPSFDSHKYRRGHVGVLSGGMSSTGAARLSAMAAARIGAGAVTVLSPADALPVNAAHLTSIMVRRVETRGDLMAFLEQRGANAFVLGPGFGVGRRVKEVAETLLQYEDGSGHRPKVVLDADAITAFAAEPDRLFAATARSPGQAVLTPHEGEFARLFPDLARDGSLSKVERARLAAARGNAVVVLKGADTVVADMGGATVINSNATPYLATAGSGDVLAGIIAGLMAQGMEPFAAGCAGVHMHAEAGASFGPGLIAEDLPSRLPAVLARYVGGKN
ncbi:NAD(P)H-hydrate dehydratase [Chelativorans composti]|jgi:yjeF C-terminal region, hydroxyethylthiazole kinase-related/yjeF N-terminal region|uniref:Bifunctional NAD(P)H-hydrate repair enzyme n=1 Tax=Chelativorans composti TaxID=768533 RepID=A0ABW5DI62_9HYPH|nr:NAD(P)H-hydrate dehydratase [bacterium SGD-2]